MNRLKLPRHVGIIMDGNRRWAERRRLPVKEGHKAGVKSVKRIVRIAGEIGIEVLTLYTFSKENWSRPPKEVASIMTLLRTTIKEQLGELMENNVKLKVLGELAQIPFASRKVMEYGIKKTASNTGLILNLALNYGGKEEILRATRLIAKDCVAGKLGVQTIDEKVFESYLYTVGLPSPDLIIRTANEFRLSNFLLWQSAYAEFYITPTLWPDFDKKEFLKALAEYSRRERRFGGRK